jgi:hypothetical protein
MNVRRIIVTTLAAASIAVPVAACSNEDSTAESTTTTTTTSTPPKNFQVSTPDGQVSLSLDGQLPPGWPTDFPLPDGADPAGSGSLGDGDGTVRVGVFTTTESGQDALAFYTDNKDVKTENPSAAGAGDRLVASVDLVSPVEGSLTVLSRSDTTYLVVVLNDSTSGSSSSTTTTG